MTRRSLALLKALVVTACLAPFVLLAGRAAGYGESGRQSGAGGAAHVRQDGTEPVDPDARDHAYPAKQTGWNWLVALRGVPWTSGLAAFGYIVLHAITYAVLDQGLAWRSLLLVDVAMRPYITVGFLALVLMIPLAVTSTNTMQRRLGRRWRQLHRLVYVIGHTRRRCTFSGS